MIRQFPPPNYDYNVKKITDVYKNAVQDIQRELAALPVGDVRQVHVRSTLAEVSKILKSVNKESEVWVNKNIPLAAREGVSRTMVSLGEVKTIEEALTIAKFNRMNKAMVNAAIADTYTDLLAVTQNIDRKTRAAVRKAVSESMRANMATGVMGRKTINQDTFKKIKGTLDSATSTGIIDAAGRRWNPEVYVDMVTRTKLTQTHFEATRNEAITNGAYYGVISSHGALDACGYHEGRVIKMLPDAEGDYPTYEDLQISGQIFHPNCRHIVTPLRKPDLLPDEALDKAEKQAEIGDNALKTGKRNPSKEDTKNNTPPALERFKKIYESMDVKNPNMKAFATEIVNAEGLNLKVNRHQIKNRGQCKLNIGSKEIKIATYEIQSNDDRGIEYQIKTAFHELFHAKSNGLEHGIGKASYYGFREWAFYDDVFAECTAQYIAKEIGIKAYISPSYSGHLIETLPKLKQLPEFSHCKNVYDVGEVAFEYRFGKNLNANWSDLTRKLGGINISKDYYTQYHGYIKKNKSDVIDAFLGNAPKYKQYKPYMMDDLDKAIKKIEKGGKITNNERFVYDEVLITAMNKVGVK